MAPKLATSPSSDVDRLLEREWLVTNGLGGYGSGSVLGVNTRRYHGLLIANLPDRGRTVLVAQVAEQLEIGPVKTALAGFEHVGGRIDTDPKLLKQFSLEWREPTWEFETNGVRVRKRIVMPFGSNTVISQYIHLSGPACRLSLRPFLTLRGHDEPLGYPPDWPFSLKISHGRYEVEAFAGAPVVRMVVAGAAARFIADENKISDVHYRVETERGLDDSEALLSPGFFEIELSPAKSVAFVASLEAFEKIDQNVDDVFNTERKRLDELLQAVPASTRSDFETNLLLAADQFVVLPGSRPHETESAHLNDLRTVIAGYHWFTDWGRDSMISMEGLLLCTGRLREARALLFTFSHYLNEGLIPNHFPEGQEKAIYNTVDATLWFFHALDRYHHFSRDRDTLRQLFPRLQQVIECHVRGTMFGIAMDPSDGLIKQGAEGYALTWMDAKADDWVVTPRRGKPVEIQALWYNALRLMGAWAQELGEAPQRYDELAEHAKDSFNKRFWLASGAHLYDVVDGEKGDDPSIRPNQIFSMALRFAVLSEERWAAVFSSVTDHLLTPVGLRTLAPSDAGYQPFYRGTRKERDAAYHQGLVWPWLFGAYFNASLKTDAPAAGVNAILERLQRHIEEAGIGSISEIFEAEPPYTPRGCIAQAWSVAELIRVLYERRSNPLDFQKSHVG
jgi:predicted glycogen debranching enzyme